MKLGLGTVQFGMDYGISNKTGKVLPEQVKKILSLAREKRIDLLDTASLYGSSESVLGVCLENESMGKPSFKIVTKTPVCDSEIKEQDAKILTQTFYQSLNYLKQKSLYGLLIHQADNLLQHASDLLWTAMNDLKKLGLVEKIGVSVYTAQQIDRILDYFLPDIVQLPMNVFDQRLIQSGHVSKLKKMGIEIHVRSVFLQGLLLMEPADIAARVPAAVGHLKQYAHFLKENDMVPLQGALQFIYAQKEVDYAIIGVCSSDELNDILNFIELNHDKNVNFENCAVTQPNILNPSFWGTNKDNNHV
jgi:aryl-alcohol dehydrogenase-like predicted oxidoreductase